MSQSVQNGKRIRMMLRPHAYRGVDGFLVSYCDHSGRRFFCRTRGEAERMAAEASRGEEPRFDGQLPAPPTVPELLAMLDTLDDDLRDIGSTLIQTAAELRIGEDEKAGGINRWHAAKRLEKLAARLGGTRR